MLNIKQIQICHWNKIIWDSKSLYPILNCFPQQNFQIHYIIFSFVDEIGSLLTFFQCFQVRHCGCTICWYLGMKTRLTSEAKHDFHSLVFINSLVEERSFMINFLIFLSENFIKQYFKILISYILLQKYF